MSTWLITSFGLPVVLTTGRLTALTGALPRHPADVLAVAVAVVLSAVTTSCIGMAHRRHRRASRRGSTS
jgi:hypothetical protein